ncbi:MAG TPA: amidohydrolase [Candidatus Nanopelagicales bacterium]|nr:amidohydrolase [Candidatus Nanopelagicales bacterium]
MTSIDEWADLYRDLHRHPELGFQETRTARIVAERLEAIGLEVTPGIGGTGVVGVLRHGDGPTVLLRADMDGLPVREQTGLPYASTMRAVAADGTDVPVMHACGHDVHVTCLLGACAALAASRDRWQGTLLAVFQPAEELGSGAESMIRDGLFERFGRPVVVLGQHVAPLPAGVIGLRPGPAFAAADLLRITLHGQGAHGSRPEASVDPVVMAAATVMRLQTVVSREVGGTETAIVTVGAMHAGTAGNVIPQDATLVLSVRTFTDDVRTRVLGAIDRIARAEAAASGASQEPDVELLDSFPVVVNDEAAVERTRPALASVSPLIVDPGTVTGSEDVGMLATAAGAPCVYWLLGGADPAAFQGATTVEEMTERVRDIPSNHSPLYAPVVHPTLAVGIAALEAAARSWLVG